MQPSGEKKKKQNATCRAMNKHTLGRYCEGKSDRHDWLFIQVPTFDMTIKENSKRKCTLQLSAKGGSIIRVCFDPVPMNLCGGISNKNKCRSRNMKPIEIQETFEFSGERHPKPFLCSPGIIEDFEFLFLS
jgi:hypothetical protein